MTLNQPEWEDWEKVLLWSKEVFYASVIISIPKLQRCAQYHVVQSNMSIAWLGHWVLLCFSSYVQVATILCCCLLAIIISAIFPWACPICISGSYQFVLVAPTWPSTFDIMWSVQEKKLAKKLAYFIFTACRTLEAVWPTFIVYI